MNRWEKIESAYHIARDLSSEDRPRFLDEYCGSDSAMRQQIEALLAQDENPTSFLNRPAVDLATDWPSMVGSMAGLTGLRVGVYEVLEPIGSGGMGEVYRARDTTLGREVALKVLPQHLALDSDRFARFKREAQVLATLNHPNIAAIYGFEESVAVQPSPQDSGEPGRNSKAVVRALVLELVEGPTLADRIGQAPIPVDNALLIARQIAEALAAAHEHGIIHRDLKPANIKIRPDGLVKVLDFGLAKALESVEGAADVAVLPTMSPAVTEVGVILGTAAYMSPEQAKGRVTDKRVDLWAFGCVLYEMLTGTRAFPGEDVSDTLAAVLRGEPDWSALPPAVPPSVRTLIEGCLQKDRRQCIADISAARFLMSERQINAALPISIASQEPFWKRAVAFAAIAVIAAGISGILIWGIRSPDRSNATSADAVRFPVAAPRGTSLGTREQPSLPAISPDGTRLVFRVVRQGEVVLAVRELEALDAYVLTGTEGASYPFWSPDSRVIAFFSGGMLKTIPAAGGLIQTVCKAEAPGPGGTWNRQGLIVFGGNEGLLKVPATGGEPSRLTTLQQGETTHTSPQFLADGRRFLYFAAPNAVYLGSMDGKASVRVVASDFGARYSSPGYLLFMQDDKLLARRFDIDEARLMGDPVEIGERVGAYPGTGETPFSVSDNGVLAYATNTPVNVRLEWVNRAGTSIQSVGPFLFGHYADPALSPDGKQVAMDSIPAPRTTTAPWANQDVWVFDLDRGRPTQLTFDQATDEHPIWSPDSKRLVFYSGRQEAEGLYQTVASGEKPAELLLQADKEAYPLPSDWSSQGILYDSYRSQESGARSGRRHVDLWWLPLGDHKPEVLVPDAFQGRFSPNGRWFAYSSEEGRGGRTEVYVKSFPPTDVKWRSIGGGSNPMWRRDGKELFYLAADGKLMAVAIAGDGITFRPDVPRPLFQTGLTGLYPRLKSYGVSYDGQRFLISVPEDPGPTRSIVVVSNWTAQLKQ
jgi:eukaryotic-like serine/threonine-protein kinase